ncbi:MAG: hypothetical protein FJ318_09115 [SAR202 cluster bacterium]|nr:hypothetical protein [SAR202 cluster bacterium]
MEDLPPLLRVALPFIGLLGLMFAIMPRRAFFSINRAIFGATARDNMPEPIRRSLNGEPLDSSFAVVARIGGAAVAVAAASIFIAALP